MTSKLKVDIEMSDKGFVRITERTSSAVIAYLYPGDRVYRVDDMAWTQNIFSDVPLDLRAELTTLMTPAECWAIATCPTHPIE